MNTTDTCDSIRDAANADEVGMVIDGMLALLDAIRCGGRIPDVTNMAAMSQAVEDFRQRQIDRRERGAHR